MDSGARLAVSLLSEWFGLDGELWIPACAGMTGRKGVAFGGSVGALDHLSLAGHHRFTSCHSAPSLP